MSSLSLVSLAEVCHRRGFVRPSSLPGSHQTGDHGGQIAAAGIDLRADTTSLASTRRSIYACQLEMNAEPPGFDRAALGAALQEWELSITSLTCLPLGAGSHHYRARDAVCNRWFVTAGVLEWKLYGMFGPTFDPWVIPGLQAGFDGLSRAFRMAAALRDAGLEFIRELWDRCGELADEVRDAGVEWLITHGQLHSANVLRAIGDVPVLIDWDCAALAPRERDLGRHQGGLAEPGTREDWAAYTSAGAGAGAGAGINPSAVDLYWHIGLLWGLCISTGTLHSPHVGDAGTRHMWTMLQSLLGEVGEASGWGRR